MNRTVINLIDAIRRNNQITKQELINQTALSLSSVNNYISELNQMGVLSTKQSKTSAVGRKPNTLTIKDDLIYTVGIDIGGWSIRIVILDINGKLKAKEIFPSTLSKGPEYTFEVIGKVLDRMFAEHALEKKRIVGLGLAISGFLDTSTMTCIKMPFYTSWNDASIAQLITRYISIPTTCFISMEDSARTSALAELRYGEGQEQGTFFALNIGAGISGGFVLNGNVFWGENGFATEIGHIKVADENKICICGKLGCLETYAASWALRRQAEIDLQQGVISDINLADTDPARKLVDATPIFQAVKSGDRYAGTLVSQMCQNIGKITSIVSQMLNPGTIFLNGGVVREIPEIILHHLQSYHEQGFGTPTKFVLSELGEYSSAIGSATLVLDTMFENDAIIHPLKQLLGK